MGPFGWIKKATGVSYAVDAFSATHFRSDFCLLAEMAYMHVLLVTVEQNTTAAKTLLSAARKG